MSIPEYLGAVNKLYHGGRATEHSYRGDLKLLLESLCSGVEVTNEPTRVEVGAPDYKMGKGDFTDGKVWINDTQYFANVPEVAWNFCIGGYQPAQKWLKDRHGRQLTFDDIRHYQRMIVALTGTAKVMEEVDKVGVVQTS